MKYPHSVSIPIRRLALIASIPLVPALATAQESDAEEEIFELSPFTIDGSEDQGYYSSQTLAGGRLKSNLKDVATSVQVVTEQMLEDIGATSMDEILVYTTNTDVMGSMSNYTAAEADGESTLSSSSARQNPGDANRVRGLGRATRTTNYFETSVPMDSYISGRVDINRGANSFLFGLGSPGGIINTSLAQAEFRDSNKIDIRFSTENFESNYSKRASINLNRVVLEDKLAIRVAALEEENEYTQKPAMKDSSRRYVAAKYKPFSEHKVTLRAHYEIGDIAAIPVDRLAPLETLSTFIDDPYGTVFDTPSGRWSHDPWNNISNNVQGQGYLGQDAEGNPVNVGLYNKQIKANGWAIVWDDTLDANGLPTRATHTGWTNNRIRRNTPYFDPNNNLTGNTQSGLVRGLRMTDIGGEYAGYTRQGLVDYEVYDWRTNLLTGALDSYENDFDRYNVTLEAVSDNGNYGIELSYNEEEWNRDSYVGVGTPEISIDNNLTLPLGPGELFGETNPNYGKLYILGLAANNTLNTDVRSTARATAFAKFDFADKFDGSPLKWFGKHTLTGLYDDNVLEQEQFANRQFIFGNDAGFHLVQTNATQYQRQVAHMFYISDAFPEAFTDSNFGVSDFQVTGLPENLNHNYPENFTVPVWYLSEGDPENDPRWNSPIRDETAELGAFSPEWQPTQGALIETGVESYAANMQSFFLNDLFVANLGWREDTVTLIRNANPPLTAESVPILDPEVFNLDGIEPEVITESAFSYGLVAKVPDKWMPEGTNLAFHYGDSSNFVPNPGGFDWYGDPVPSSSGSTREIGATLGLMNNKLVARLNFYKGSVENEPYVGTDRAYKLLGTANVTRGFTTIWSEVDRNDRNRDGVFDIQTLVDPETEMEYEFNPDENGNGYLDIVEFMTVDDVEVPNPNFESQYFSLDELLALEAGYSELMNPWVREVTDLSLIPGSETEDGEPDVNSGNGLWFTLGDTVQLDAKGMELELTYNPSRNLRLSMNVTQQESMQTNIAPRLTKVWNEMLDIYESIPNSKRVSNGANKLSTELTEDEFAESTLPGNFIHGATTGQAYFKAVALSGSNNPEVREWRVNLLGNYSFSEGRFKGMNIGGAFRYQDEAAAGYGLTTDPISGFPVQDVSNPYFDEATEFFDLWVGYKRKVFNDTVDWRIQLNVRNLFADKDPLTVQFQPDGSIARVALPVPRQFSLSNTFSF
ncbi:TonB-dependent receptor plug domain-containing protein [Pelagicoccus sp. SDUM812005]|uniref:TonB-dependent receptor plug domain-containing protein n=1 Tax=Pelagicoccus sp. SDUM812005 TaxID=3041257 RepID=UPI00280E9AE5|nr:TonB-dependent receptor plug domain-containing protein [Pelagicoccus sp. SDUM812005]MDQ8179574.1 hypothetical protein [Pelagicoccus sp. SDUM812005]